MALSFLAMNLRRLRCCLIQRNRKFDLPAALIECRNLDCGAFEIIGDEGDHSALVTSDLDASQRDREAGIALAGKNDVGIADDVESIADGLANIPRLRCTQARAHLAPRDEESPGIIDLLPPAKVIIALVEHVG